MLRLLLEGLSGREKISDDILSFEAVGSFLLGLDRRTKVYVNYNSCGAKKLSNVSPEVAADFLRGYFPQGELMHTEGCHQVFKGLRAERHYIDVVRGKIMASDEERVLIGEPFTKAGVYFNRVLETTENLSVLSCGLARSAACV